MLARVATPVTTRCLLRPSLLPMGNISSSNRTFSRARIRDVAAASLHGQAKDDVEESVGRRSFLFALASGPGIALELASSGTVRYVGGLELTQGKMARGAWGLRPHGRKHDKFRIAT